MGFKSTEEFAEALLSTIAPILRREGLITELDIIVQSEADVEWQNDYEGILRLKIDAETYDSMGQSRHQHAEVIDRIVNRFVEENISVRIVPKIILRRNWRDEAYSLSKSQFGTPQIEPQHRADVFMLMPFSIDIIQEVYTDHIIPTVLKLGLTIKRADDIFSTQTIMKDIWSAINASGIIIADCTGRNPNVFYELGISHTLGKKAILIAQDKGDIPFDIQQWRYIIYGTTSRGMTTFASQLKDAIVKLTTSVSDTEQDSQSAPYEDIDQIPF